MKALIINGLRKTDTIYEIVSDALKGIGWEVNGIHLHDKEIAPCQGCFGCWTKTPGICIINDEGREVAKMAVQSHLMLFLTPVTFGGYSSDLKKAVDRLIQIVLPFFMMIGGEMHHKPRYSKYPHLVGIGVLPQPDEESEQIFKTLVARNAINLHSPSNAAGIVLRDSAPEKLREEVKKILAGGGIGE